MMKKNFVLAAGMVLFVSTVAYAQVDGVVSYQLPAIDYQIRDLRQRQEYQNSLSIHAHVREHNIFDLYEAHRRVREWIRDRALRQAEQTQRAKMMMQDRKNRIVTAGFVGTDRREILKRRIQEGDIAGQGSLRRNQSQQARTAIDAKSLAQQVQDRAAYAKQRQMDFVRRSESMRSDHARRLDR